MLCPPRSPHTGHLEAPAVDPEEPSAPPVLEEPDVVPSLPTAPTALEPAAASGSSSPSAPLLAVSPTAPQLPSLEEVQRQRAQHCLQAVASAVWSYHQTVKLNLYITFHIKIDHIIIMWCMPLYLGYPTNRPWVVYNLYYPQLCSYQLV